MTALEALIRKLEAPLAEAAFVLCPDSSGALAVHWGNTAATALAGLHPGDPVGALDPLIADDIARGRAAGRSFTVSTSCARFELTFRPVRSETGEIWACFLADRSVRADDTLFLDDAPAPTPAAPSADAFISELSDAVVIFRPDSVFSRMNDAARASLGTADANAARATIMSLAPEAASGNLSRIVEWPGEDGETCRPMHLSVSHVGKAGARSIVCILTDLPEMARHQAERAAYFATVNHEMRTPLSALIGSLDLMAGHGDAPVADRLLGISRRNADRLLHLLDDLAALNDADHRDLSIRPEPLSADHVLSEAADATSGLAARNGVSIAVRGSATATFAGDPRRMQQILANLISNAVKFSPRGGTVNVSATVDRGQVTFSVADSGPGIPEGFRARLFQRFARAEEAVARGIQGTGLGLAITRDLVVRQGGSIDYMTATETERPGAAGTEFRVRFPLAAMDSIAV